MRKPTWTKFILATGLAAAVILSYGKFGHEDPAPAADPEARVRSGFAHYEKKEYDAAQKDFDEAIRENAKNATAYYYRGHVHYQRGDKPRAREDWLTAIANAPEKWEHLEDAKKALKSVSP